MLSWAYCWEICVCSYWSETQGRTLQTITITALQRDTRKTLSLAGNWCETVRWCYHSKNQAEEHNKGMYLCQTVCCHLHAFKESHEAGAGVSVWEINTVFKLFLVSFSGRGTSMLQSLLLLTHSHIARPGEEKKLLRGHTNQLSRCLSFLPASWL